MSVPTAQLVLVATTAVNAAAATKSETEKEKETGTTATASPNQPLEPLDNNMNVTNLDHHHHY